MSFSPPAVLAFAASDPTGGAGIQADILAIAGMGAHPLSVLTALTVQDTHGVQRVAPVDAALVAEQARRVLGDIPARAFKIGVLGSADNARAVAAVLAEHPRVPVVLDPVLASARGDALGAVEAVEALLPLAALATPNSLEARRLAPGADSLAACAQALIARGCRYVLVTGTHEAGAEVVNTLYDAGGEVRADRWPRLPHSYHGSGCTLASAIAAALAHGAPLEQAVREGQAFTWRSLAAGYRPGGGQHVPRRSPR
ncbi:MAG TPA: hydroxymethylpyrimidine/phosphomethylpyrimidine kinase [Burkholderiales bacterium]